MFIKTDSTPNPNSLKFVLEKSVSPTISVSFEKAERGAHTNFAKQMFQINGVEKIFILDDFVTITKTEQESWDVLKPQILSILMDFISTNQPLIELTSSSQARTFESEIEQEIYNIIEDRVKPAVALDGGDIEFVKFTPEDGVVYVSMHGSCSGCPSSTVTLKDGIKRTLQYYVPEVMDVLQV
jgi:NFU1 iron-sulfur cluster scaffold homolog, mitochondrial